MEGRQTRVLGAARNLSEAVSPAQKNGAAKESVATVVSGNTESLSLATLEQALGFFTNHNSTYTNVGEDEFHTLADEVLNNSIRSVLVYDEFSNYFGDAEVYSLGLAFQYNLSVEAITLSGINVSDEAISSLCEALVRSRVNYIDLSNTPLEDSAGQSLAALAHINPYLRTVVLDATLVPDDILDEIDMACQFNQSNFEGNDNHVDESLFKSSELGRLKQRLQHIVRAHNKRVHYCVAHAFGCCPNGNLCLYSHTLSTSDTLHSSGGLSLSEKISELFSSGGLWEDKLPPRPEDGASWRNPDEAGGRQLKLNFRKNRTQPSTLTAEAGGGDRSTDADKSPKRRYIRNVVPTLALLALALTIVGVTVARRQQRLSQ